MKTKNLYKLMCCMACLAWGVSCLTACGGEEDFLDTIQGPADHSATVSSDSFVVDYSVGAEAATRAGKAERIRSLFYLIYDSDGKLLKERKIPDINEQAQWPLTRQTMTWAQREALKDTLSSRNTYTSFFLANVQSAEALAASSPKADLLVDATYLTDVQLKLPAQRFEDTNMMYVWKEQIKYQRPEGIPEKEDVPRDHPLSKNIVLRRILSRFDLTSQAVVEKELETKLRVKETDYQEHLKTELEKQFEGFAQKVSDELKNTAYQSNCKKLNELLDGKSPVLSASILGVQSDVPATQPAYLSALKDAVQKNPTYLERTADWALFGSSVMQIENLYNRFSLNHLAGRSVKKEDEVAVSPEYLNDGNKACWIGFSSPKAGEGETLVAENLTGIHLKKEGVTKLELSFTTSLALAIAKNMSATFVCDPIATIAPSEAYLQQPTFSYTLNLKAVFNQTLEEFVNGNGFMYDINGTQKSLFLAAIRKVLAAYGGWDAMKVSFTLPQDFTYTATVTQK